MTVAERFFTTPGARIGGLVRFEAPTVHSRRVQCQTCGSTGLGVEGAWTLADIAKDAPPQFLTRMLSAWQRACIAGHEGCRGCGRIIRLTSKGNGRAAHSMGNGPGSCVYRLSR